MGLTNDDWKVVWLLKIKYIKVSDTINPPPNAPIINFTPHFTEHVISCPCCDAMLVKRDPGGKYRLWKTLIFWCSINTKSHTPDLQDDVLCCIWHIVKWSYPASLPRWPNGHHTVIIMAGQPSPNQCHWRYSVGTVIDNSQNVCASFQLTCDICWTKMR